jgi:NYN domain
VTDRQVNLGVSYDGGWFAHVSSYFAHRHPWRARIALQGLHDALRWHIHSVTALPLADCVLAEAHYVRGRSVTPSRSFDHVLEQAEVIRHDADLRDGTEKGANVMLALEAWTRATSVPLQAVALISGDADLAPVASRLETLGVHVVVPVLDVQFTGDHGEPKTLRTAPRLIEAASTAPAMDDLLAAGLAPGWPLRYPFTTPVHIAAVQAGPSSGRRHGTVTRWIPGQTSGFITEAGTGASWFASRDDLPGGVSALPPGTLVTFNGSPRPAPSKQYPRAYAIRAAD